MPESDAINPPEADGWNEHRIYITSTLERIELRMDRYEEKLDRVEAAVQELKTSTSNRNHLQDLDILKNRMKIGFLVAGSAVVGGGAGQAIAQLVKVLGS